MEEQYTAHVDVVMPDMKLMKTNNQIYPSILINFFNNDINILIYFYRLNRYDVVILM